MTHLDEDTGPAMDVDSDEEDWEEVDAFGDVAHPESTPHIEITLKAAASSSSKQPDPKKSARSAISYAERLERVQCHKLHTLCLIANASTRNHWLNDELLQARLLSLTPLTLQNAFASIHKSRVPDARQRGRLFESAITRLTEWWSNAFHVTTTGHIRSQTFDEVRRQFEGLNSEDILDLAENEDYETIRSEKSLMKHALMWSGSRDTSAQLFTALCRALGIPARLVVSLQSMPWQAGVDKSKMLNPKRKLKLKPGEVLVNEDNDGDTSDTQKGSGASGTDVKVKGKARAITPEIRLRKTKGKNTIRPKSLSFIANQDPTATPPVFWTEVFSRPDGRWLAVDPIRCIVNKRKVFDPKPPPSSASALPAIYASVSGSTSGASRSSSSRRSTATPAAGSRVENRMLYVLAFEEDGYARDVTPRYAREYGAKVAKMQGAGRAGKNSKGRQAWWQTVLDLVKRPYRLQRDDIEDEELEANKLTEAMPTSMAGFKDHPLYVLERHVKRDEVVHPLTEIGKFRGEPVYPRSNVISLRSAESFMREGRVTKEGEQPRKWVKMRAATVRGMRAIEVLKEAGSSSEGAEVLQGLYSVDQTKKYVPEPVIDGKIPKNDFGNIDLYVPSMLPKGAVHIPFKRIAKIARKLGFDYAEAVTGFEFKKRRAFPVLEGVVVAAENEQTLIEAYLEAEQDAAEKEERKRQERVIKLWTRLVQGLRIRQRLQEQYKTPAAPTQAGRPRDVARDGKTAREGEIAIPDVEIEEGGDDRQIIPPPEDEVAAPGGYLVADDVVQAYHLPRYLHDIPLSPSTAQGDSGGSGHPLNQGSALTVAPNDEGGGNNQDATLGSMTWHLEEGDDDDDPMEEAVPTPPIAAITTTAGGNREGDNGSIVAPLTMNELISQRERRQQQQQQEEQQKQGQTQTQEKLRASKSDGRLPTPSPVSISSSPAGQTSTGRRLRSQTKQQQPASAEVHGPLPSLPSSAKALVSSAGLSSSAESRNRRRTRADDDRVTSEPDPAGAAVLVPVTHVHRSRKRKRAGSGSQADPGKEDDKEEEEDEDVQEEKEEEEDSDDDDDDDDDDEYEDAKEEKVDDLEPEVLWSGFVATGRRREKTRTNGRGVVSATGSKKNDGSSPKRTRRSTTGQGRGRAAASAVAPRKKKKTKVDTAADRVESVLSSEQQQQQSASTRVLRSRTVRSK